MVVWLDYLKGSLIVGWIWNLDLVGGGDDGGSKLWRGCQRSHQLVGLERERERERERETRLEF